MRKMTMRKLMLRTVTRKMMNKVIVTVVQPVRLTLKYEEGREQSIAHSVLPAT